MFLFSIIFQNLIFAHLSSVIVSRWFSSRIFKTMSLEENLIENVRLHKSLYDIFSTDYKDQHIRKEAWEEIGDNLQMPGKILFIAS